jgi:ActR/RegA family two-component response regulator
MSARPAALLVEDDEQFSAELLKALEEAGLSMDHATGWDEGLELFRVNGYELVVADYNLPDTQHGLQLLARMKMLLPTTRLVLISGALTRGAERALDELDLIDAYLSKSDGNLTKLIAESVERAEHDATKATDWRGFGAGYVADLDRDFPQVQAIDAKLRADVQRDA